MYGYIYKTTNLVNGKIYIGQKHSSKFLGQSYLGSGKYFKRAVKCYGKENFSVELLEKIESEKLMDEREIYWVSYYHATDEKIGYNISEGGRVNRTMKGIHNPMYHKTHSKETRDKISKHHKGLKRTEKFKKEVANRVLGKHWYNNGKDEKYFEDDFVLEGYVRGRLPGRKRMSPTKETIEKIRQSNKGKKVILSEAQRNKLSSRMSEIAKNTVVITNGKIERRISKHESIPEGFKKGFSDEHLTNFSKYQKSRVLTTEQKEKISQSISAGLKKSFKEGRRSSSGINNGMYGKTQSKHTKDIISSKNKDTICINNGQINKMIKKELLDVYEQSGWKVGRLKK